jgi:transcriptional regulator with XRE-family HTH domain
MAVRPSAQSPMNQRELEPSASVPAFFGAELRHYRKVAGLTQDELGELINYTGSMVGQVETARRAPMLAFAEACDRVLGTGGALARLWSLVNRYPAQAPEVGALEASAVSIRSMEPSSVPGLLQTPEYARALLKVRMYRSTPEHLDQAVADLMTRQSILDPPNPPLCWFVVGEAALRCLVGGRELMRDQLAALLTAAERPDIAIQVMPYDAGAHAVLDGSLTLLTFTEGSDVGHTSSHAGTALIEAPDEVAACSHGYAMAIATALSPHQSADFIRTVMQDL